MGRYADWACGLVGFVVVVAIASTAAVTYYDYLDIYEELSSDHGGDKAFYDEFCTNTKAMTRHPRLREGCHESQHAAFDDVHRKAMRRVIMRWSFCDQDGCEALMDRFGKYFSIGAVLFAAAVGAWCCVLVYRVSGRRWAETLPTQLSADH